MFADYAFGGFAIAHNGNLTNAVQLRRDLMASGSIFNSTSDTETLIHLVALSSYSSVTDKLVDAAKKAFIVTRIGDFGFMLGILYLFFNRFEFIECLSCVDQRDFRPDAHRAQLHQRCLGFDA